MGSTAGIAQLQPGRASGARIGTIRRELYFLLEGEAVVTIDGAEFPVAAGACVFIPGDAEHGIRNAGTGIVRFLYVFPTDSFADVAYRFTAG